MARRLLAAVSSLLLLLLPVPPAAAQSASGEPLYVLTSDDRLVVVRSDAPEQAVSELRLTGADGALLPDVLAVDVRPATSELYALTVDGRLHVVDEGTGAARPALDTGLGDLSGRRVGFDVDEAHLGDRAVVVVDDGRSVDVHLRTGEAVAERARYADGDPAAGAVPQLVAAAFDPQWLYALDAARDTLVRRATRGGTWTTVGQGLSRSGAPRVDVVDGALEFSPLHYSHFAVLDGTLHAVDTGYGTVTARGRVTSGSLPARVDGLAVATPAVVVQPFSVPEGGTAQAVLRRYGDASGSLEVEHDWYSGPGDTARVGSDVAEALGRVLFAPGVRTRTVTVASPDDRDTEGPEVLSLTLRPVVHRAAFTSGADVHVLDDEPGQAVGLTTDDRLVLLSVQDAARPRAVVAVTGLPTGTGLVGIDARPRTGDLLGLGSDSRLYRLDPGTGAATVVGPLGAALEGAAFGVDVDPAQDRLRVVSDTGQHLLVDPDAPSGAGTRVLPRLRYREVDGSGTPTVSALSHRAQRDQSTDAVTASTWYALTRTGRQLEEWLDDTVYASTSLGVGLDGQIVDSSAMGYEFAPSGGAGFAVVRTDAGPHAGLYRMDPHAEYATKVSALPAPGAAGAVEDLALLDVVVPRPAPTATPAPTAPATTAPTASPTASPSSSPSAPPAPEPLGISVTPWFVTPGVAADVIVTGPPGALVHLLAYSRPDTTYDVVRRAVLPGSGRVVFSVTPGTNTRMHASTADGASTSPSVVLGVETALSLSVVRHGVRDYTFQGRVLPRRAGQLITLYRVERGGRNVITAQLRTDGTGTYRFRRTFTGSGTFGFVARTGRTLTNAAGASDGGHPRTVRVF